MQIIIILVVVVITDNFFPGEQRAGILPGAAAG